VGEDGKVNLSTSKGQMHDQESNEEWEQETHSAIE
jgi:hypothetical protein